MQLFRSSAIILITILFVIFFHTLSVQQAFANAPPVADAGPNRTVDEGSSVTLNGSNSYDPDIGDSITYKWIQTGGNPTVTLNGANTATPGFTAPYVGPGGAS